MTSAQSGSRRAGYDIGGIFHLLIYININNIGRLIDVSISLLLNSPDLGRAKKCENIRAFKHRVRISICAKEIIAILYLGETGGRNDE